MKKPNFVKQTDYRYRNLSYKGMTMGAGGCGVMSCFNVISVLTKPRLTPKKLWKQMTSKGYVIPGQGTTWNGITQTLKDNGIHFKVTYSDAEVRECLKKNMWLVGLCGRSRWTSSGHYIVIYKLKSNGKISVSDPYSSSDYCQENGTLTEYLNCNKCNWIAIDPNAYDGKGNYKATKVYNLYVDSLIAYVRSDRSTKKKAVGTLPRGTQLVLYDYEKGWYRIKKGKFKGKYISEKVLTNLAPYKYTFKTLNKARMLLIKN